MAEELKPRSIRLSDTVYKQLKEIAEGTRGSTQDIMQMLVNTYYLQEQKVALPDYKSNIDEFEKYITALVSMYTQSLQAQQDTRRAVMQEFDATLKSKDNLIMDLQDKLNKARLDLKVAEATEKEALDESKKLQGIISELQSKLQDKDKLSQALTDSCNSLKGKIEQLQADAGEINALREQVKALESERDRAIREHVSIKEQLRQQTNQAQLTLDRALLDADRTHQQKLQDMINEYQNKYFGLLKQMQTQATSTVKHGSPTLLAPESSEAPAPTPTTKK